MAGEAEGDHPTYGIRLDGNPAEIEKALAWTSEVLELKYEPAAVMRYRRRS
jgi:malate dehydrogenase (quinone)